MVFFNPNMGTGLKNTTLGLVVALRKIIEVQDGRRRGARIAPLGCLLDFTASPTPKPDTRDRQRSKTALGEPF